MSAWIRQVVLLGLIVTTASSCTVPIVLAVGAVSGYAVSRDTFEGVTAKSQDEIWSAAEKVLSIMGSVSESDKRQGEIKGRVSGADVLVTLLPVNLTTTKVRIKARKGIFPRVGVAQDVYSKIMIQLGE